MYSVYKRDKEESEYSRRKKKLSPSGQKKGINPISDAPSFFQPHSPSTCTFRLPQPRSPNARGRESKARGGETRRRAVTKGREGRTQASLAGRVAPAGHEQIGAERERKDAAPFPQGQAQDTLDFASFPLALPHSYRADKYQGLIHEYQPKQCN